MSAPPVLVHPFPYPESGRVALDAALEAWDRRFEYTAQRPRIRKIERLDPPVVNGEPVGMPYFDEAGDPVELPPMSAWRIEGAAP